MGKANKVKGELIDVNEMVQLIQVLKDIADNKFFTLLSQKDRFTRFGESFVEFFRMISFTKAKHPLIENDNPKVGIVVVTAEGSFLGEFNNKIIRTALEEKENYSQSTFIAVGDKCVRRLELIQPDIKGFINYETKGLYEIALEIKDYLVKEVMEGRLGKVKVVYSFPKSFEIQKPRAVDLLPCVELIKKQSQHQILEKIIEESNTLDLIGKLADLWLGARLYEILFDTIIAAAAAQSKMLDDSLEKMKKEQVIVKAKYRKAKKGDIDNSLREVFSARMVMANKK